MWHCDTKSVKGSTTIRDVVGIIEATGYKVSLDYLDTDVKEQLDYDPSCPRIPFNFTQGSTTGLPTLAAVGFYEGPFWGVMEMQARYILGMWAREPTLPDNITAVPERHHSQVTTIKDVREALKSANALHIPQFWMSDYVGFVEEFAREIRVMRDDSLFGVQKGPIFPARYRNAQTDDDAMTVQEEVSNLISGSTNGTKFVPAAVFRGMQGIWKFNRSIVSRNAAFPSDKYVRIAQFLPRVPLDSEVSAEYLYIEDTATKGDTNHASRNLHSWVCTLYEDSRGIVTSFSDCKARAPETHTSKWTFSVPEKPQQGWKASGLHRFCEPDAYDTDCEFKFTGASLESFCINHRVTGPGKDYTHETWYERPKAG